MGSNKNAPNSGLSKKIEMYLKKRVGQTVNRGKLLSAMGLKQTHVTFWSKLKRLEVDGCIEINKAVKPMMITVLPAIKDHKKYQRLKPNKNSKSLIPTPAALATESILHAALDTQPLDIAGLMHRVTQIDQQNKIYRNALEQIVSILEQARIIETQK